MAGVSLSRVMNGQSMTSEQAAHTRLAHWESSVRMATKGESAARASSSSYARAKGRFSAGSTNFSPSQALRLTVEPDGTRCASAVFRPATRMTSSDAMS